jgi:hypothetical protein
MGAVGVEYSMSLFTSVNRRSGLYIESMGVPFLGTCILPSTRSSTGGDLLV